MIFRVVTAKILYTQQNKKESRKLYFSTAIKFTYSLALTWNVEWRWLLRKVQRDEIPQNCPFPLPFLRLLTVIAFHRVKKFPLITGIVDQISIQRVRAVPYLLPIAGIIYVSFVYFAAIAQAWINLHRQHASFIVMLWKGNQVPRTTVAWEISVRGWRRSRDEKGNQGVGDFRFINILQFCSIYLFFSITLSFFFLYFFFYPRHSPTPTPTPTTFSYTRYQSVTGLVSKYRFLRVRMQASQRVCFHQRLIRLLL